MQLISGANIALPNSNTKITIKTQLPSHLSLDVTAYLLHHQTQQVRGDADMIFYGQKATPNQAIVLQEQPNLHTFTFDTSKIDSDIHKIPLCAIIDGEGSLNQISQIELEIYSQQNLIAQTCISGENREEKALILGEVYLYKGIWKFRFVDQGFNGGLRPLAEHFGVEISDAPIVKPKLNLSKVTLDKNNSSINLKKNDGRFGKISVNLNWNRSTPPSQSFLQKIFTKSVDLDLGALIEFKNGKKAIVQALGNDFGSMNHLPYVYLEADDRTGSSKDGEWLYINGDHWSEINRIVVYAFIYEGVPNWASTDAYIILTIPNQAPIEVALTDGTSHRMCSIVELKNLNNTIQAQREIKYFKGHERLDKHYGFGFNWIAATK